MKFSLYSISYLGIWYTGSALDFETCVKHAKDCGYDGYFGYELCHPVLNDAHEPLGLGYVDEQVKLAREFMEGCMK